MFIDVAEDETRSQKRKRTEKKKPSTLLLNKEVRYKPDDIARFSISALIFIMFLKGLPSIFFFIYEHRYAKIMNIKVKRTPRRLPRSYLRGALRYPAKLFRALRNER
ncbi:hypothetical protein N7524_006414 [Penicillium chrysogenum]|nr:hypothetical protein N7524_006414 [Penicillium chrysogenum]